MFPASFVHLEGSGKFPFGMNLPFSERAWPHLFLKLVEFGKQHPKSPCNRHPIFFAAAVSLLNASPYSL